MTKLNPNNGHEIKSDISKWATFKSDIIFHWSQILKYFNDFCNGHGSKVRSDR